ncbi:bifunctional UDP-N-acetylmuramoyl-tripeptide:D-alanyl-D-alanine ligase/alanine racemase [Bacteroides gallinaceum]|uniref:Alanine racemase n=2 Tax=Bacteroidaceae TaxID=815 RepID=A0ABT7X6Y3_9BACE|nr:MULTISPECIES: bifunctional UDP-N-acetylmuramoyl-tripeptide:D-alanyl-D-alanine ligase/alanine racemase [Bacteroidaceae]CCZ68886.1 alanine racemase [Bacteroides sp. CAG:702]MBD8040939.1 bifunctional UDP-N-acetylmuramoyl-tripeptide:D-alanyl-D-alanine ligase/alanine racemase [Phocaeicola intestinalis]MBM6658958.1 bifunctional UDP-N-acetylmuramoyl-tripeptide:D-alanyl-D-alanine ligase/alanine racemase [Bacteroides gallinaceum]MBM6719340.1 bifunctional UDP-N-acetylmuramoyl-tripeptide:D-alanyl-D-ala
MSSSIEEIVSVIGANRVGDRPAQVDWILTDSRSLCFPEETLFFALKTKRNDGHKYIEELYARGVYNFVVTEIPKKMQGCKDINFLVVSNVLKALQRLAAKHREQFDVPVVGITGSNGKTVVKEWLYQLLSPERRITRSPRSYNSQIGVPLSVWMMDSHTELGIFEAGISEMGEMEALEPIIRPTIGVLTNIGGAHQENFTSLQEKCMEKLLLFKDCDVIIYNGDNELISSCVAKSLFAAREIAWSMKDVERPLFVEKIEKDATGTTVKYRYLGFFKEYRIPYIDDASIENSLNCLAVALYLMVSPETIAERMACLEPVAMRLEVKEGKNGCVLINDSYNSDFASLDIALDFMARRSEGKMRRRTLILSDILETGQPGKLLYRQVADLVHSRGVDRLIGVGEEISAASARFEVKDKQFFQTTKELIASGVLASLRGDVVLVKGARAFHFDEVTDLLELKVHETILEINLNALVDNLNYYRNKLKPETKLMCMVKASAYGAGPFEVAKTLEEHRVDYLAVAVADEGADLRKAGITCPIIIMNPEVTAFKTMFAYRLEPNIYGFRILEDLIKAAEREGVSNFPIHIKIDTGMHRLGFDPYNDMKPLVERLNRQSAVIPRSVFSHLVGSDSSRFDAFTRKQIETFEAASAELQAGFTHKILRHICNTAGIERYPGAQFDMVRLGIGLYGIDPYTNRVLHNVSTLKTTILQIHNVSADETIGYSRKGVLHRDSRIATVPIGYADGLNRHLGNGNAYCLVNGQKAPYIGNICMDVCMIDVTGIDCKEGDKVVVFGDDLPVTVLSNALDTIPYEILTNVSNRVKRVYFQD